MARLKKSDLVDLALQAIADAGWTVELLTDPGEHPARFRMLRGGVEHLIRLYIWNLSHGGKSRSEHEFRIQITGIEQFEPEPGGRTLILGWGEQFGVFAGFDIQHRLGALGSSPSIQLTDATLQAGAEAGGAAQDKGDGEHAIAVRPSLLDRYVENLEAVHAGDLSGLIENEAPVDADDLEQSLDALSNEGLERDFTRPGEDELRADIIAKVDSLLGALDESRPAEPGQIGHNQPPEPLDADTGVAPTVEDAAKEIRDELAKPEPNAADVGRAGAKFAWAARLLEAAKAEGAKLIEKGKDLAREYAAKALWGAVGTIGVVFKEEIVALLHNLAEAVLRWLQHVTIF
jgi:hypothetical protein